MLRKEAIVSRTNEKLKSVRRVREGKQPELLFIEGVRLVREALSAGVGVDAIYVSDRVFAEVQDSLLAPANVPDGLVNLVSEKAFDSITDTVNSQGIVLIGRRPEPPSAEAPLPNGLAVYLFEISNPANLGAVLRSAEGAGADLVITSPGSADPFGSKALRASMGSAFRLPVLRDAQFVTVASQFRDAGFRIVAAGVVGGKPYAKCDLTGKTLIVIGSEGHGINEEIRRGSDEIVTIPLAGEVESLNLTVSAGILLFEAARQRDSLIN